MFQLVKFAISIYLLFGLAGAENISGAIVGGERAPPGQAPFLVSLRVVSPHPVEYHFCGGNILNSRWLLTAAHCFGFNLNAPQVNLTLVRAVAGTNTPRTSGERYGIIRYVEHPLFVPHNVNLNDIALLKTELSIQFNALIQPIPMRHQPVRAGDIVTVAGWGMTQGGFFPSGPGSEELNMIDMNVISNLECRRRLLPLSSIGLLIRDNVFCTFNGRGQSPCFGDSGSGFVLNGEIVGIVTMGVPCAVGFPDWKPRVSHYIRWIESHISA